MDRTHQLVIVFCSLLLFLSLLVPPLNDGTYKLVLDASGDQIDFPKLLMEFALVGTIYGAFRVTSGSNLLRLKAAKLTSKDVKMFGY